MKNILIIIVAATILVLVSKLFTVNLVAIGLFTWVVLKFLPSKPLMQVMLISCYLFIDNIFVLRMPYWGSSDREGIEVANLITFIGFSIAAIVLAVGFYKDRQSNRSTRVTSYLLFLVILASYMYYFSDAGFQFKNCASRDVVEARRENTFTSYIKYSDSMITYGTDTIKLGTGWIEKQTISTHCGLLRKNVFTGSYIFAVPLIEANRSPSDIEIYFSHGNDRGNGSQPATKLVSFVDSQPEETSIFFWHKFKLIKGVRVFPVR